MEPTLSSFEAACGWQIIAGSIVMGTQRKGRAWMPPMQKKLWDAEQKTKHAVALEKIHPTMRRGFIQSVKRVAEQIKTGRWTCERSAVVAYAHELARVRGIPKAIAQELTVSACEMLGRNLNFPPEEQS